MDDHGAGVALGFHTGDGDGSRAGLDVVLIDQGVFLSGGKGFALCGDGDPGLDFLTGSGEAGAVNGHIGALNGDQGRGILCLGFDVEGMLHGSHVAAGGNAGDYHGSSANRYVILVFQGVVPVQGQQAVLHPDGDIGPDFFAGVLEAGLVQRDIRCHQLYDFGLRGQGAEGQGRGCQKQCQRQAHTAQKCCMFHIGFSSLCLGAPFCPVQQQYSIFETLCQ